MIETFIHLLVIAFAATIGLELLASIKYGALMDKKGGFVIRLSLLMVGVTMAAISTWLFF